MKIHHVGYLVKDINKAIDAFEKLGIEKYGDVFFDEDRKSHICFMGNQHEVELIAPGKESDIYPLLKKYCNMPYHICYDVQNLDESIVEFTSKGFLLFKDKMRACAISDEAQVAFLIHAKIGIIELVQEKVEGVN